METVINRQEGKEVRETIMNTQICVIKQIERDTVQKLVPHAQIKHKNIDKRRKEDHDISANLKHLYINTGIEHNLFSLSVGS